MMKEVLITCGVLLALISTTIIASTTFEDEKENVLNLVTKRIDILNEYKDCLENANNKEGMRACKRNQKTALKALRLDSRERKKRLREQEIEEKEKL